MTTRRGSRSPRKGKTNWAELEDLPAEKVESAAREDHDAQPLTDAQIAELRRVPDPKRIRESLGMTQKVFAAAFDLPLGTLRDWEQGRYHPDQASKNFLRLVAHDPRSVQRFLASEVLSTARRGSSIAKVARASKKYVQAPPKPPRTIRIGHRDSASGEFVDRKKSGARSKPPQRKTAATKRSK